MVCLSPLSLLWSWAAAGWSHTVRWCTSVAKADNVAPHLDSHTGWLLQFPKPERLQRASRDEQQKLQHQKERSILFRRCLTETLLMVSSWKRVHLRVPGAAPPCLWLTRLSKFPFVLLTDFFTCSWQRVTISESTWPVFLDLHCH